MTLLDCLRQGETRERLLEDDIEEVEILEALLANGVSLLEILEARERDPERRNIGLKNFLVATYPERGNDFLRKEHENIGVHAKRLFFGRD